MGRGALQALLSAQSGCSQVIPTLAMGAWSKCALWDELLQLSSSSPAPSLSGVGLQLAGQRNSTAVGFLLAQLLKSGYLRTCVTSGGMEASGSAPKLSTYRSCERVGTNLRQLNMKNIYFPSSESFFFYNVVMSRAFYLSAQNELNSVGLFIIPLCI